SPGQVTAQGDPATGQLFRRHDRTTEGNGRALRDVPEPHGEQAVTTPTPSGARSLLASQSFSTTALLFFALTTADRLPASSPPFFGSAWVLKRGLAPDQHQGILGRGRHLREPLQVGLSEETLTGPPAPCLGGAQHLDQPGQG